MSDLEKRELLIFVPFVLLVLWLGVAPGYVMERVAPSVEKLRVHYEEQNNKAEQPVSEDAKTTAEEEVDADTPEPESKPEIKTNE